jgi:hypothetical protein
MRAAERRAEKAGNQLKPGDDARHSVGGREAGNESNRPTRGSA